MSRPLSRFTALIVVYTVEAEQDSGGTYLRMNIIFDLDGTLTDPKEGILNCIQYALEGLGNIPPPKSELEHYIGPPLHDTFRELLATDDTSVVDHAIALYRERFGPTGLYENMVYPEIPETLDYLRSTGATLFVGTSKPRVYAEQIINHFNLNSFFNTIHGSELDGTRTNKAELIGYILREEQLASEQTMMIGDRKHDAIGALANKVQAHGVLWGYGSQEELQQAGCHALYEHPKHLRELVESR